MTEYLNIELLDLPEKVKRIRDALLRIYDLAENQIKWPESALLHSLLCFKAVVLEELPHPNEPRATGINLWENARIVVMFDVSNGKAELNAKWLILDSTGQPVMHSRDWRMLAKFVMFDPNKF
jgi:hypothetical protein